MAARFDVAVIGAGAAGMMCAAVAGQRGRSVVIIDHAEKLAEKIRISGGGRCNFTNREVGPQHFISRNPHFARAALQLYSSRDFIDLVLRYRIGFHEKHRGQLFCDESSEQIIAMLVAECDAGRVQWRRPVSLVEIAPDASSGFRVETSAGSIVASRVVVATGGLSIPKIGATDFAFRTAKRFGLRIVEPRPALVPLTFAAEAWAPFQRTERRRSRGRHRGTADRRPLSRGPAVHASWLVRSGGAADLELLATGTALAIDLAPGIDLRGELLLRKASSKQNLSQILATFMPKRLATQWQQVAGLDDRRIAEMSNGSLATLASGIAAWQLVPSGTEGFRKAEVTVGGIDTDELSQRTLEAKRVPGLYFIGEAVDVTGWLGGYNFQWAWSSGYAAGQAA